MEIIKGHKRVRGFSKEENKRRYYLHKKIRKIGGKISTSQRIVFVPLDEDVTNPDVIELGKIYGYQIQTEAFTLED